MTQTPSKTPKRTIIVSLAVALVIGGVSGYLLVTQGCGDSAKPPKRTPTPVDSATAGSIKGLVLFKGTPPPPKKIESSGDAACAREPAPVDEYAVVIADKSGRPVVQNAFVW